MQSYENSPISDIFGGQFVTETKCANCGHCSRTFDPFRYCSLALPAPKPSGGPGRRSVSLGDCFRESLKGDLPDGYKCEECGSRKKITRRESIYTPPRVLVTSLKRYSKSRGGKRNNTLVRFPVRGLDLSDFIRGPVSPIYDLVAVSQHSGSMGGGHYTSACRENQNSWGAFSDEHASQTNERELETSEAYILFYVARG